MSEKNEYPVKAVRLNEENIPYWAEKFDLFFMAINPKPGWFLIFRTNDMCLWDDQRFNQNYRMAEEENPFAAVGVDITRTQCMYKGCRRRIGHSRSALYRARKIGWYVSRNELAYCPTHVPGDIREWMDQKASTKLVKP